MIDGHWIKRRVFRDRNYLVFQVYCKKCQASRFVKIIDIEPGYVFRVKSQEIRKTWEKSKGLVQASSRSISKENCELNQVESILDA